MSSSSSNVRVRRVSGRQLEILWEYLNSHRDIAVAYNRSHQAKEYSKQKWRELAEILNCQGEGVYKDWKGWSKYWVDFKAKLKRRAAAMQSSESRTRGGSPTEPPLTEIELKFITILGKDPGQGLPGVPMEPFAEHAENVDVGESPAQLAALTHAELSELRYCRSDSDTASRSPIHKPTISPTASATETSRRSPRRRHRQHSSRATSPAPDPAVTAPCSSTRRRRRHMHDISQEAARRALVQISQRRADAADRSASALERIAESVTNIYDMMQNIYNVLQNIDRTMNAGFPRAAE